MVIVAWWAAAWTPWELHTFDPGEITVLDAVVGAEPELVPPTPQIKRRVVMAYNVLVKNSKTGETVCDGSGKPREYLPEDAGKFPDPLGLGYWGFPDERCGQGFPVGSYNVRTCWTPSDWFYFLPPQTICRRSHFDVYPAPVQIQIAPPKTVD